MRSGPAILPVVWTYEGWLYLAVVLDLFSRRVNGWAMAAIQDEPLIETALRMALLGRQPAAGLLFIRIGDRTIPVMPIELRWRKPVSR